MELGNLEMILRISRWHGIAPYSSLSTLQVSRGFVVYGIMLDMIYSLFFLVNIVGELYIFFANSQLKPIGLFTSIEMDILFLLLISATILKAPRRLTHIKQSIQKINEINMKIEHQLETGKVKYKYLALCCTIFQFGFRLFDYYYDENFYLMYFGITHFQLWKHSRILLICKYNIMFIVSIQMSFFTSTVLSALVSINKQLEKLISEQRKNILQRQGRSKEAFLQSLRDLSNHYSVICDIVRESMQLDGLLLCLFIIYFFVHLGVNLLIGLFFTIYTKSVLYYKNTAIISFLNFFIYGMHFMMFVEPFHRTYYESQRTCILVNSLKAVVIDDENETNEIENFQRLLLLNRVRYSPLNVLSINRSLMLKILGGVMTYVVTFLTYGPKRNEKL